MCEYTFEGAVKAYLLSKGVIMEKFVLKELEHIQAANQVLKAADKIFLAYKKVFFCHEACLLLSGCHPALVGFTKVIGDNGKQMTLKYCHLRQRRKVPARDYVIQIGGGGLVPASLVKLSFNKPFAPPRRESLPQPPLFHPPHRTNIISVKQFKEIENGDKTVQWRFGGVV